MYDRAMIGLSAMKIQSIFGHLKKEVRLIFIISNNVKRASVLNNATYVSKV